MKIDVCSLIENADKLGILKEEMKVLKRVSYSLNNEIFSESKKRKVTFKISNFLIKKK